MKLQLIDDWRSAHKRFASIQIAGTAAAVFAIGPELLSAWGSMPDDLKSALPHGTAQVVSVSAFVLVLLGRYFRRIDAGANNADH
jgi:hypothetical protein